MAGFFGLFDYTKPGKGVDKNSPQKKRIFVFFELYFRKFWKLITLNLIYILFCIPIITIGPATTAMALVLKNYSLERPVFLFSDFFDAFKKNFKQSFLLGIINALLLFLVYVSFSYYSYNSSFNWMYLIPFGIITCLAFILIMMGFYLYIMIPVLDMKFKPMIKNSFLLSIVGIKSNLLTMLFVGIITFLMIILFPISLLIVPILYFSTIWFIIAFNTYPVIEKFVISPYYEQTGEKRPDRYYHDDFDEFDELVFEDIGSSEVALPQASKAKSKTIK